MLFQRTEFNILPVGRGATGIYLILKQCLAKSEVIVPVNICYAAVFPIILSGCTPVFCDVSYESGNASLASIVKKKTSSTGAVLLPHMYGNPNIEIEAISSYCQNNDIILIEDCASAMGAEINGKDVGTFGDYSIFSTGYAKTVECGYGGFVVSRNSLEEMRRILLSLPLYSDSLLEIWAEFSKKYRVFRNSGYHYLKSPFCNYISQLDLNSFFLFRLSNKQENEILKAVIEHLSKQIIARRRKNELYNTYLADYGKVILPFKFNQGAVPWRFSMFVNQECRVNMIKFLLSEGIPVSDWYPSINELFGCYDVFPGASQMEQTILNFPLNIEDYRIKRICEVISLFIQSL